MGQVAQLKRTWNFKKNFMAPFYWWCSTTSRPQSHYEEAVYLLPLFISINWPRYSKTQPVSCTNTHHDVTDLINHGIVKNTKTWISWERNITFLRNKKILNLCFRWQILRSYRFVAEVTFKVVVSLCSNILHYRSPTSHIQEWCWKGWETQRLIRKILQS